MDTPNDNAKQVDLLASQRQIERLIYQVGYALEAGDFARVGELMGDATLGADRIGRKAFWGAQEIRDQYTRTNVVYPDRGRASKEIYHNILVDIDLVDIDLDADRARSVPSYTVAHQAPGEQFAV